MTTQQCIAWFDGFSADTLSHYVAFGDPGGWRISNGKLTQDLAAAPLQGIAPDLAFRSPQVMTRGTIESLMPASNDAGVTIDRHAIVMWVSASFSATDPYGCRLELDDTGGSGTAYATAYRNSSAGEMLVDSTTLGVMFAASLQFGIKAKDSVMDYSASASLGANTAVVGPTTGCAGLGESVALGTRFTRASFDSLLIAVDCAGPMPCGCTPPTEM